MQASYTHNQLNITLCMLDSMRLELHQVVDANIAPAPELYEQVILGNLIIKWGPHHMEEPFALIKHGDSYELECGLPISITADNKIELDSDFIADAKLPTGRPVPIAEGLTHVFSELIISLQ